MKLGKFSKDMISFGQFLIFYPFFATIVKEHNVLTGQRAIA